MWERWVLLLTTLLRCPDPYYYFVIILVDGLRELTQD